MPSSKVCDDERTILTYVVGKLPCKDCWRVFVSGNGLAYIGSIALVTMVLELTTHYQPTICEERSRNLGNSVDQSHDKSDANGFSLHDSTIEQRQTICSGVEFWLAILP